MNHIKENNILSNKIGFQSVVYFLFTFILILIGILWTFIKGKSYGILLYLSNLIFPLCIVLLILFLSISLGQILIKPFNKYFPRKRFSIFIGTLLSFGLISHLMLILGIFKLFDKRIIFLIFFALILITIKQIRKTISLITLYARAFAQKTFTISQIIILCIIVLFLSIYFVNSFSPSANYDVLEYHLGAFKHFYESKDISPVPNNFYSALPYHIEMMYLFSSYLEGCIGGFTPKIFVFLILILNSIGVFLLIEAAGMSLIWRLFAVLLFISNQTIFRLGFDAFNDLGVALYFTAFCISVIMWIKNYEIKLFYLMGIFLGLMLCCKYTVFGMYVFPAVIILMPILFIDKFIAQKKSNNSEIIKLNTRDVFKAYFILIAISFLVYSPWLLKGWVKCSNPVYPFFNNIFNASSWTSEQAEFLFKAHGKVAPFSSEHFANCIRRINGIGAIYILPIFAVFLLFRKNFKIIASAFLVFASYFIWNLVSNAPDRFLAPIISLSILLQCFIIREIIIKINFRNIFILLYAAFFLLSFISHITTSLAVGLPQSALGIISEKEFLSNNINKELMDAVEFVNNKVPKGNKALLIYEARQFLFECPVLFNTVFDQSPILNVAKKLSSGDEILEYFKQQKVSHVLVNELELSRFIQFYTPLEEQQKRGISNIINDEPLNRIQYLEYYGPYQTDPTFLQHSPKIKKFMELLEEKKVYESKHPSGLRVFVTDIR